MSAYGLAQALGISTKEAEQFIAVYFARYAGVQAYMQETLAAAERDGRVETLYGRVRYLPDIQSSNWNLRENARRMAINARIQGTAADLMKLAMIAVDRRLRAEHPRARLLLSVHDEAGGRGSRGRGHGGRGARPERDGRGRGARGSAGRRQRHRSDLVRRQGLSRGGQSHHGGARCPWSRTR